MPLSVSLRLSASRKRKNFDFKMCKTNFIDDRLSKINFRLIVVPRFGPLPRSSCISISNREFNILCYVSRPHIADALSISRNSDRET